MNRLHFRVSVLEGGLACCSTEWLEGLTAWLESMMSVMLEVTSNFALILPPSMALRWRLACPLCQLLALSTEVHFSWSTAFFPHADSSSWVSITPVIVLSLLEKIGSSTLLNDTKRACFW